MDARYEKLSDLDIDPHIVDLIQRTGYQTFGSFVSSFGVDRAQRLAAKLPASIQEDFRELVRLAASNSRAFTRHVGLSPDPLPTPRKVKTVEAVKHRGKEIGDRGAIQSQHPSAGRRQTATYVPLESIDKDLDEELRSLNAEADEALVDLQFNGVTSLVSETDDQFGPSIEHIQQLFQRLFELDARRAYECIKKDYPSIFLVYSVYQAKMSYDKRGVWSFLDRFGIRANTASKYKKLLFETLKHYEFPVIDSSERDFYYMYTMLLNGGFNEISWRELWSKTILPLIYRERQRKLNKPLDAALLKSAALSRKQGRNRRYGVCDEATRVIIEEAPEVNMLPLLGAALDVGREYAAMQPDSKGSQHLVSSHGLNEIAMSALSEAIKENSKQERKDFANNHGHHDDVLSQGKGPSYIKEPRVLFEDGAIKVAWPRQHYPDPNLAGMKAEFTINGEVVYQTALEADGSGAKLETICLEVANPFEHDSISVGVTYLAKRQDDSTDEPAFESVRSRTYDIIRPRPHCLEFIKYESGRSRLRNENNPLRRQGRQCVLIVVENGFKLSISEPHQVNGQLVTSSEPYFDSTGHLMYRVYSCDVSHSTTYALRNEQTGSIVEMWSERFAIYPTRNRKLGITTEGIDVYGFAHSGLKKNLAGAADHDIRLYGRLDELESCTLVIGIDNQGEQKFSLGTFLMETEANCYGLRLDRFFVRNQAARASMDIIYEGDCAYSYQFFVSPFSYIRLESIDRDAGKDNQVHFSAKYILEKTAICCVSQANPDADIEVVDSDSSVRIFADLGISAGDIECSLPGKATLRFFVDLAGLGIRIKRGRFDAEFDGPIPYVDWLNRSEIYVNPIRIKTDSQCPGFRYASIFVRDQRVSGYSLFRRGRVGINPFRDAALGVKDMECVPSADLALAIAYAEGDLSAISDSIIYSVNTRICLCRICPTYGLTPWISRERDGFSTHYYLEFGEPLQFELDILLSNASDYSNKERPVYEHLAEETSRYRIPYAIETLFNMQLRAKLQILVPDGYGRIERYELDGKGGQFHGR